LALTLHFHNDYSQTYYRDYCKPMPITIIVLTVNETTLKIRDQAEINYYRNSYTI